MAGYGQFCPVAQALEVIGERWTLLIVRELLCGSTRFNELARGVPLMSRSMLAQRLKSLEDSGVLIRDGEPGQRSRYRLTPAGEELRPIVERCGVWGQRWARRRFDSDSLDPSLLMWDIRRGLVSECLPSETTTVEFRLRGGGRGQSRYWLRVEPGQVDLCLTHPGFDVDLTVRANLRALTQVWLGERELSAALRDGSIELDGPPKLRREFPGWLRLSTFAGVEREHLA